MNKYCKLILKYLNKHSSKDKPVILDKLYKDINCDTETIDSCLNELKNLNLVKVAHIMITYKQSSSAVGRPHYWSTTLGKNYFKDSCRKNIKNFFLKLSELLFDRILLAMIISIITSLLTTLITIYFFGK